jgi:hypothetical protein
MAFWGAAKSLPGFFVAGPLLWVPDAPQAEGCLEVTLTLSVNGEVRQRGRTMDLIASRASCCGWPRARCPRGGWRRGRRPHRHARGSGLHGARVSELAALLPGPTARLSAALRTQPATRAC